MGGEGVFRTNFQQDVETISRIDAVGSILEVVCRTTGMGFAAVARVTEDRWVACAVRDEIQFGLVPGDELKVETTICHEIRQNHQAVVIDHVAEDACFVDHATPKMYGFQSYISMPIMLKDGSFFGTLCAIDPRPAHLKNPTIMGMFKLFADLIAFHLNAIDQLALSQSRLLEERRTAELREQFIAILGHDLRNPVGAVSNVAQILLRMPLAEQEMRLATIIQDASYRMKGLIDNILDFARGRLGSGIALTRNLNEPLERILVQVITEMNHVRPDRVIEADFSMQEPVYADGRRIAQLLSNLLGNALTYGKEGTPVRVEVSSGGGEFLLAVTNAGEKIPEAVLNRLFQPFTRGEGEMDQQGLGLGLYIASEIARAHGGTLEVESAEGETRFMLRMPAGVGQ